jgi:hypothetical protein
MSMGTAAERASQNLRGASYLARTCGRSRSKTLPAHLESVLGSRDPGQMRITTWSESVQPLQSVNPHMIRI